MVGSFYLAITLLVLWRIPDLHAEIADFPDRFFMFIRPGVKWDPAGVRPFNIEYIGYDGQWFYDLARDPFQPGTSVDKPSYRSARLVYPLVVRTFALGREELIPLMLVVVNGLAIVSATYLLARLFADLKKAPAWAFGYALWPGTVCAYLYDLSEPLCFALIIAALWLQLRRPSAVWQIGGILLLASLTKELALLYGLGWLLFYLARREWGNSLKLASAWLLPFVGWQILLWYRFGKDGLSAGEPFSWLPFGGFFAASSQHPPLIERSGIVMLTIGPLLLAGLLLGWAWWKGRLWNAALGGNPWFFILLTQGAFLLVLPTASFVYLIDHARNNTGLSLILYLIPLASFDGLRRYLLVSSLVITALLITFYAASGTAFLYSFGL